MPNTREYQVVGEDFLDSAATTGTLRQLIPASAEETFAGFEDADAWPVWLDPVDEVVWTSPQPFGVGTTRDIKGRTGVISETFFAWEHGRRMGFYFASGAVPGLAAFAEDWALTPRGVDECELVWRYGFEFAGAYKVLRPVVAFAFKRMGAKSLRQLAQYMADNRDRYAS
ncbi:MAG: SRPBCC family protein [Acidimicrobiales bacterium]